MLVDLIKLNFHAFYEYCIVQIIFLGDSIKKLKTIKDQIKIIHLFIKLPSVSFP